MTHDSLHPAECTQNDSLRDSILSAIECLERITWEDDNGARFVALLEDVDLNKDDTGHVNETLRKLRLAVDVLSASKKAS